MPRRDQLVALLISLMVMDVVSGQCQPCRCLPMSGTYEILLCQGGMIRDYPSLPESIRRALHRIDIYATSMTCLPAPSNYDNLKYFQATDNLDMNCSCIHEWITRLPETVTKSTDCPLATTAATTIPGATLLTENGNTMISGVDNENITISAATTIDYMTNSYDTTLQDKETTSNFHDVTTFISTEHDTLEVSGLTPITSPAPPAALNQIIIPSVLGGISAICGVFSLLYLICRAYKANRSSRLSVTDSDSIGTSNDLEMGSIYENPNAAVYHGSRENSSTNNLYETYDA